MVVPNFNGGGDGGNQVALNHAKHKTVVDDMHTAIDNIRKNIQHIETAVDNVKNGWRGQANQSFNSAAVKWHDEAETLKGKLDQLNRAVDEGGSTITKMDQA